MTATEKQQKYLDCLFIDTGYSRAQRNSMLSERFGRDIRYLDELTVQEASTAIEELKEQKERNAPVSAGEEDED